MTDTRESSNGGDSYSTQQTPTLRDWASRVGRFFAAVDKGESPSEDFTPCTDLDLGLGFEDKNIFEAIVRKLNEQFGLADKPYCLVLVRSDTDDAWHIVLQDRENQVATTQQRNRRPLTTRPSSDYANKYPINKSTQRSLLGD